MSITSINLICDLIEGTYQDGKRNNCLYNFPYGSVNHGYRIVNFFNSPIYLPLNRKTINSIRFKIVDQENNLLDFNGENISFALHHKQVWGKSSTVIWSKFDREARTLLKQV